MLADEQRRTVQCLVGFVQGAAYADAATGIEPANAWAVVTVWFGRIAGAVTTELTERWGGKIAAVDTFTPATVEALVVSLSTDAPAHLP